MNAYAISLSKYVNTGIFVLFTLLSYLGFTIRGRRLSRAVEIIQRILLGGFLINANMTIAWFVKGAPGRKLTLLCAMEILFLISFMVLYRIVHEMANMFLFNNICMLLSVGFVMVSRIAFYGTVESTAGRGNEPIKQFVMASAGLMIMLIIPFFRKLFDSMRHFGIVFAALGILALLGVLLFGDTTNGAHITVTISGFTFQPSEFIKILFILMIAGMLSGEVTISSGLLVTALAAVHVVILVVSRDLGSALIFFVVYLMMMFLASGKWSVLVSGFLLGGGGAVLCYHQFAHVQTRVAIWRDPFSLLENKGFQIAESLFSISYGGLWGSGLTQGLPTDIPNVETDFIFSAIAEEMGLIFSVCLLLLCLNSFFRILMLSSGYSNRFFQLYTYGAAVCYIFQTFLTVGGQTKFIPMTGVTLPLVSYGGSSILSTLIMLGIVEMVFILHEERTAGFMERYEREKAVLDSASDSLAGAAHPRYEGGSEFGNESAQVYPQRGNFESDGGNGPYGGSGTFVENSYNSYAGNGSTGENSYAGNGSFGGGPYSGNRSTGENSYAGRRSFRDDSYGGNGSPSDNIDNSDNFPVNGVSEEGIFEDYDYNGGQSSLKDNDKTDHFGFYHPQGMNR